MTFEQECFLKIISDYIHQRETESVSNLDWEAEWEYSHSNQLDGIVFTQCKKFIPKEYQERFSDALSLTVYYNQNRFIITKSLMKQFESIGLNAFLVKGPVIAEFYPNPQLRTMGDIDILVSERDKAHEVMLKNGFKCKGLNLDYEYGYVKNNIEYELHNRLLYDNPVNNAKIQGYFDDYKSHVIEDKLDDSFHFVFVLCHLRTHFMNQGVGFRQFLDIAMLANNNKNLDWDRIKKDLQSIDLFEFAQSVFAYLNKWFEIESPFELPEISESDYEKSTVYIFNNGLFGFHNEDNDRFMAANRARNAKSAKLSILFNPVKVIFPGYKQLSASRKYEFIRNKPYLLPYAWIKRFFIMLKDHNLKQGMKMLNDSVVTEKYVKNREEFFKLWGLDNSVK